MYGSFDKCSQLNWHANVFVISSLQGKLEAEHSANKLLHEEASILREHAANLQQSDNVRKHEVGADDDVSDSVKSCAECNNLKKQLADTQKMLHATKVQLATLLATNSAGKYQE